MKEIEFIEISEGEKKILLDVLGYDVDEKGLIISREDNKPHRCPYTKREVFLKNASILPGSTIIIDTSVLSLSEYVSKNLE
jgi:hypothetical protein